MTDEPNDQRPGAVAGDFLTAGRFAHRTLLSAKALRIYADRGLLPPDHVDPGNGYRWYRRDQVRTGWLIGLLRSAGLSLDAIAHVVHADDPDQAVAALDVATAALDRRATASRAVLARVRSHLTKEPAMTDSTAAAATSAVTGATVPDQCVLSVLRRLRPDQLESTIGTELTRLREAADAAGLRVAGAPFGVFHEPVSDDSDGPLEIALPVDDLIDLTGDIRSYRLPGGTLAARDAIGEETWYPQILGVYDEVHAWITDAGHTPIGPPREIWHNAPSDAEPLHLTIAWPYVG